MNVKFDRWVKTSPNSNVQHYGEQLLALGASWETFRKDPNEVISDICSEGSIPKIAAREILSEAMEALKGDSKPLAIFWDINSLPIPSEQKFTEVYSRLKSVLSPYGQIQSFRAYTCIDLNIIPEEKRFELQLTGCHLVCLTFISSFS
mmetsp:Transcript_14086/g.20122  ORF Transcript_14086/g.20122 Transcript_14086/m.20122 type:complete len:148 (-) Transcript_14086:2083-2526(-)